MTATSVVFKLLLIKLTKNMGTHDFGCALKHFALFTYHVQGGQVPKAPLPLTTVALV